MSNIKVFFATLFLVVVPAVTIHAQQETVSPAKKQLIKELLAVTNTRKNTQAVMDAMLAQVQKGATQSLSSTISQSNQGTTLTSEREQAILRESAARVLARFKLLFAEKVNMVQLVEDLSYPLYDKYFTAEELQDLITFYKSKTGQKAINVMPQLFAESMGRTSAALNPAINEVMKKVMDEETEYLKRKMAPGN